MCQYLMYTGKFIWLKPQNKMWSRTAFAFIGFYIYISDWTQNPSFFVINVTDFSRKKIMDWYLGIYSSKVLPHTFSFFYSVLQWDHKIPFITVRRATKLLPPSLPWASQYKRKLSAWAGCSFKRNSEGEKMKSFWLWRYERVKISLRNPFGGFLFWRGCCKYFAFAECLCTMKNLNC